jgi:hypothetical protein
LDLEAGQPGEEILTNFKFLRLERKMASSSLWAVYSCLNSKQVQCEAAGAAQIDSSHQRLRPDAKQKAVIFDDVLLKGFMVFRKNNAYWLVCQAICIVVFFSGCACKCA